MKQENDPMGEAVLSYYTNKDNTPIIVRSSDLDDDIIDTSYLFRKRSDMPKLEKEALKQCSGKVLDIGACSGCHSLILQDQGLDVTALDISQKCCDVMISRGIRNVVNSDIFEYKESGFDTILLLMNGIGIAQSPDGIVKLLSKLKLMLNRGGKILLDSSDLVYLYEEEDGSVVFDLNSDKYYGIIDYKMSYKNIVGESFDWIFADQVLLSDCANLVGMQVSIIQKGEHYDYLAQIKVKE